ncbi:hypothetical protein CLV24_14814, partial [Pontibacter ummariensis]
MANEAAASFSANSLLLSLANCNQYLLLLVYSSECNISSNMDNTRKFFFYLFVILGTLLILGTMGSLV